MLSLWLILAVFLVIAIPVVLYAFRKRSSAGATDTRPPLLAVVRSLAIVFACITATGTVIGVIQTLVAEAVSMTLPVAEPWPHAYPWVTDLQGPTAEVVNGGFNSAEVTVRGLDFGTRMLQASGQLLQGTMVVVIAVTLAVLCHRLLGAVPFRPVVRRSFSFTAAAVMVGGFGWQICFQAAGNAAAQQVLRVTGWGSDVAGMPGYDPNALPQSGPVIPGVFDPLSTGLPQPGMSFSLEFWPLFLGLGLLAIALAFRYSERLQRDTEGLV